MISMLDPFLFERIMIQPETMPDIPGKRGSYILVLKADRTTKLQVGRLGLMHVIPGWYYYCGSARGPGGLRGRLLRHIRVEKKKHWHIDYLMQASTLREIYFVESTECLEHSFAEALGKTPGFTVAMERFGATDCRCPSHLFYSRFVAERPFTA